VLRFKQIFKCKTLRKVRKALFSLITIIYNLYYKIFKEIKTKEGEVRDVG
jgi:hypothetical protein